MRKLAVIPLFVFLTSSATAAADLEAVYLNGHVITGDEEQPFAEAFAVSGTRFTQIGTTDEVRAGRTRGPLMVDLRGRTVLPGLIDAHTHPIPQYKLGHRMHQVPLSSSVVQSFEELTQALKRQVERRPAGDWILGFGYEDTVLGRHPTRDDLDRISLTHPIYITHSSGHRAVVNSHALAEAGISDDVENPPGGAYGRDPDGRLNGILLENASDALRAVQNAEPTFDELSDGVEAALRDMVAHGLTTIVDATPRKSMWMLPVYERLRREGRLPVRMVVMVPFDLFDHIDLSDFVADEWLSIGGVKVFHGNSLSGRTAWLSEHYVGRPDDFGIPPERSQAELNALVRQIHERGFQAAIHSNGDLEIDMVLTAIEALPDDAATARHRIEHASVMTERLLTRAKIANVVLALHSYVYEHGDKMEDYGAHRWDWMHVNRRAMDMGVVVAGNSDYPISGANPFLRFQSLVTRQSKDGKVYGGSQRITVRDALKTYTHGAAYSIFQEHSKGSMTPGKLADFVIVKDNPLEVEGSQLGQVKACDVYIGGRRMHSLQACLPGPGDG